MEPNEQQIPQQNKNYMFYFFIALLILVVMYMAFRGAGVDNEVNFTTNKTKVNLTNITINLTKIQTNNSNTTLINYSISSVTRMEVER